TVQFPSIEVLDTHGLNHALAARTIGTEVVAPVRALPRGDYTIRWHILSADGHVVSGVWTFGVRMKALPPTEAYGASGPTTIEHVIRWLYFVALALVSGSVGFRAPCLRGLVPPPRVEKRLYARDAIGVLAAIELRLLAFCLR